jgi:hypothetical protein
MRKALITTVSAVFKLFEMLDKRTTPKEVVWDLRKLMFSDYKNTRIYQTQIGYSGI